MIIVSSFKPFDKSPEYAENQRRAADSWQELFTASGIFYVGHFQEGLDSEKTQFVRPDGDYPTIKMMADFASHMTSDYVALVNADIVLGSGMVNVEQKMREMALPAATSYRYEFDPAEYPNLDNATRHKEDRGMDIFMASPAIWKMVAREIPETLWFGHNSWDTWICGFFCHHLGYGFRHFTDQRCVFHPKHEGRCQPHVEHILKNDPYLTRAKRPSPL